VARPTRRPQFDTLVADWLATRRSANTRAAYGTDVREFARWCAEHEEDPLDFDARALRRYRSTVERSGASSATVARRLSAIASFGTFAAARDRTLEFSDVTRPSVEPRAAPEVLGDREAAALLAAADAIAVRAALLVRLLMLDGLKVGEAAAADVADVTGRPPRMALTVGSRMIPLHPDTATALHAYVARRRSGPLLLSEGRARRSDRLSRFGIDFVIKEVARAAGVTGSVSGNSLRRRYVVAAHAEGTAVEDIRRRAGHADVRTTRRYLS